MVQLGHVPPQTETFPSSYPYRSSVTRALRENFAELATECSALLDLKPEDLVIDIGGNDGNLLSSFVGKHRVLNVTPEDMGRLAVGGGIHHLQRYWDKLSASLVLAGQGKAKLITATNVFAHVPDPNEFVEAVLDVLTDDGVFLTESHYLGSVLKGNQWDTIYGEHARIYSLASLTALLKRHGIVVAFSRTIDSHGGSIRVYACRPSAARGMIDRADSGRLHTRMITEDTFTERDYQTFPDRVAGSKTRLWDVMSSVKRIGGSIVGIGAPSRASTLISYTGIDHNVLDYVCEIDGSHKLGKFMPGTLIPVVPEQRLYQERPDFAIILSWHVKDSLMRSLRERGFTGKFIVPLPFAEVVS